MLRGKKKREFKELAKREKRGEKTTQRKQSTLPLKGIRISAGSLREKIVPWALYWAFMFVWDTHQLAAAADAFNHLVCVAYKGGKRFKGDGCEGQRGRP